MTASQRVAAFRAKPREARESSRWEKLATDVSNALPEGVQAIHVMDQEANDFDLFAEMHRMRLSFVVRACPSRQTTENGLCVKDVLEREPAKVFRKVAVNPRSATKAVITRGRHPARTEREATLKIRWGQITIPRRQHTVSELRELSLLGRSRLRAEASARRRADRMDALYI
jgi:hypothetical protein